MTAPGTMGQWWVDRETERARQHAAACRDACEGQDQPSDLPRFADLRDGGNLHDYSDDGPGALFMMLVCLVLTVGAIAAAFVFI